MYALLDWDNTLRTGFTIFDLGAYLDRHGILAPKALPRMEELREEYRQGRIDHDKLAEEVPDVFARGLKGVGEAAMEVALIDYRRTHDEGTMHAFTRNVFAFCRERGIEMIIVSGAPGLVVRRYRDELGISEVNAFECEAADGAFTGRVAVNNGFNKRYAAQRIIREKGEPPLFAMGDSSSDAGLLEPARMRISVGPNWDWVPGKENHYNCSARDDGAEIVRFIEQGMRGIG